MANTDYLSKIFVAFAGQPLEELTSFRMNGESQLNKVVTIIKGISGFSSGAKQSSISLTAAIPIDGPEFEFWNEMKAETWIDVQVGVGSKDCAGTGKIQKTEISASTDKAAEISVDWEGRLERFE